MAEGRFQLLPDSLLHLVSTQLRTPPQVEQEALYLASQSEAAADSRTSATGAFGSPVTTSLALLGASSAFGAQAPAKSVFWAPAHPFTTTTTTPSAFCFRLLVPLHNSRNSRIWPERRLELLVDSICFACCKHCSTLHLSVRRPYTSSIRLSVRSNNVYEHVETSTRILALTSTTSDSSVIEATDKPGSTPYDALLPADAEYVSLSPAEVQEASKSDKFE
ncbi:hypothetical protein CVT26_007865 [Gymnopilus dilepis]|uniref:Uncharacterized protein n=1 Tax=Gymnopilus dilepis TaxID=231916 RepID=A0A409YK49_9AGAR|nr:hypothetical protein CVT26_007865 [Gymnopilus dilepis]